MERCDNGVIMVKKGKSMCVHVRELSCSSVLGVEEPDGLREESVAQCEGPNSYVPLSRWQEGKKCV